MNDQPYLNITPGKSCLYASFTAILNYRGYQLSESDVFFLTQGMWFQSMKPSYHREIIMPNHYFTYRSAAHIVTHTAEALNLQFQCGGSLRELESFTDISAQTFRFNPVMILISPQHLNYVPRQYNPDAQQELHCILLCRTDEETNISYIADSYVVDDSGRVSTYAGPLSTHILRSEAQEYIYIQKYNVNGVNQDVVRDSVLKNLLHFTNPPEDANTVTGLHAIAYCMNQAANLSMSNNDDTKKYLLELSYLLKAHFIISFDYLIDYLKCRLNDDKIMNLLSILEQIRKKWSNFCMKIWKSSFNPHLYKELNIPSAGNELLIQTTDILCEMHQVLLADTRCLK